MNDRAPVLPPSPVCPSVCLSALTDFHPLHFLFYIASLFSVFVCVCACVCYDSPWKPSLSNCLLAVKSALKMTHEYACYSTCKLPVQADQDELLYMKAAPHLFDSQQRQIYVPTRCTHAHTFSSTLCLHVSVSDVVFSASLHFHMCTPIVSGSAA